MASSKALPYLMLITCTCINVVLGFKHVWSVLVPYLEREFCIPRSLTVLPFSLMTVMNIVGFLSIDYVKLRLGLSPLLMLIAASSTIGLLLTALSPNIYLVVVAYAVVYGVGHALGYVLAVSLGVKWFYVRGRGLAAGMTSGGYSLGTLVLAPITSYLVSTHGWRYATLVMTGVTATVMSLATVVLREPAQEVRDGRSYTPLDVVRTRTFYVVWFMIFLTGLVDGFAVTHLVPYAVEYVGVDVVSASLAVSVYSAVNFLSRVVMGTLTNYLGIYRTLGISYALSTVNIALFGYYRDLLSVAAGSSVIGLLHGTNIALTPLISTYLWGSRYLGSNYGLLLTAATTSMLVGPLIGSVSYDLTGSYSAALITLLTTSVAGLVLLYVFTKLTVR